jgi:ribonuclease Z
MMKYGVSYMKVKAVFLSHLHLDHFLGIFGMVETMRLNGRQEKLSVYGPPGTKAAIGKKGFLEAVEFSGSGQLADFGDFSVSAFEVRHAAGSFGFVFEEKEKLRFHEAAAHAAGLRGPMFREIQEKGELKVAGKRVLLKNITYVQKGKKLAYSGDTAPCPATAKAAKGADLLIHEATFSSMHAAEAKEALHSTASQAAEIAKKAGVKRLLLTHISGRYKDTAQLLSEAKAVFPSTLVAEDGMRLQV